MYYKKYKQHDERDCGAACIATVFSYYGVKLTLAKCKELVKVDNTGSNIYGLVDAAKQEGFNADAYQGSYDELKEAVHNGEFRTPIVAHIHSEEGLEHFVVILKMTERHVHIFDPAYGIHKYTIDVFCNMWTGHIVVIEPTDKVKRRNENQRELIRYLQLLKGQYLILASAVLLSFLIVLISLAGSFIYKTIIDDLMDSSANAFFLFLIGLYVIQAGMQIAKGYIISREAYKLDLKLMDALIQKIYSLPLKYIEAMRSGELLSRFTELTKIRDALTNMMIIIVFNIVCFLGGTVVMCIVSVRLFLVAILLSLIYVGLFLLFRPITGRISNRAMSKQAQAVADYKELIDGTETLNYYGGRQVIDKKLHDNYYSCSTLIKKRNIVFNIEEALAGLIESIGIIVVLWVGISLIESGGMTIGLLMTFTMLVGYIIMPIREMLQLQPVIQESYIAMQRLNDILDIRCENRDNELESNYFYNLELNREIHIRNLDYRYANHALTLKNVNCSINQGEKIAIVGENGCGKSTLMKLLLKIDTPEKGEICIGEHNISDIPIEQYREKIAYVPQEIYLFNNTIRENILLGNEKATDREVDDVIEKCFLKEWIVSQPNGLDTYIEEHGRNLSGGQRQRIAFARVLLRKPELILLDEATSQIDRNTDRKLLCTLFEKFPNTTCIIITHKSDIIEMCDRVIYMQDGSVASIASHMELMRTQEKYCRMWKG